jgi:hypothetical protein
LAERHDIPASLADTPQGDLDILFFSLLNYYKDLNLWQPKVATKDGALHLQVVEVGVEVLFSHYVQSERLYEGAVI